MSCYGYRRKTTPNLDSVAKDSVMFTNYYCSDAPCLPSRSALMSGRYGIHNGVVGHGGTTADPVVEGTERGIFSAYSTYCLPRIFMNEGMLTASISSFAHRHSNFHFYAGFNEMISNKFGGMESGEYLTPKVLNWLDNHEKDDNWFLHVNYWDAHTPYRAPESFGNPFENEPLSAWITEDVLKEHNKMVGPHKALEIAMYGNTTRPEFPRYPGEIRDMAGLRKMMDGYDTGILFMDTQIGMIFDKLREQGNFDDLAIIISADHGENMGELGIYGEHATADHPTCRIPMIIKWPGCKKGHVDNDLHLNIDLAPTLAELFGQERKPQWDGDSYVPSLMEGQSCGREYAVLSQCAHVCQRSVRFGDYIYIKTYHDGFHLFDREMLFNLKDDPYEQHDLKDKEPEIVREGSYLLSQWYDEMMLSKSDECTQSGHLPVDPLFVTMRDGGPFHARGHLKRYAPHLEKTGRGWAVAELQKRHPREPME